VKVLLDVSPWGITETMSYDHATGILTIQTTQNVAPILENNIDAQNQGFDRKGDIWPIASVPETVLYAWMGEYEAKTGRDIVSPYNDDDEWNAFVYARLDDSDYRKLRTGLFRIGR